MQLALQSLLRRVSCTLGASEISLKLEGEGPNGMRGGDGIVRGHLAAGVLSSAPPLCGAELGALAGLESSR